MNIKKNFIVVFVVTLILIITGCSSNTPVENEVKTDTGSASENKVDTETSAEDVENEAEGTETNVDVEYPIVISHAFGETVIESKPERVATISWGNQDIPLALGVEPVGISMANYGVPDDSGLLPWTAKAFKELGVENPVLFNDLTAIDYEAINDVKPDVILAAYSGITSEEYEMLSQIAPVVAYPESPWQTSWREQIIINATAMGMEPQGKALVDEMETLISQKSKEYSQIVGKSAAFFWFNPADLGTFYVYMPSDPRSAYLLDMGMIVPESVQTLAETSESIAIEISAENIDRLNDVDIIITYGTEEFIDALQADALLSTVPAVERGSVVVIPDGTPLAASGTPTALSIPESIDEYLTLIETAAELVE